MVEFVTECCLKFDEIYYYDETSPSCLRWKISRCRKTAGDVAGGLTSQGYYRVRNLKSKFLVHRVIWEMFYGKIPAGFVVDHIDRVRCNNTITNLRLLNHEDSAHNCKKKENNTSGVTGGKLRRWQIPQMEGYLDVKQL